MDATKAATARRRARDLAKDLRNMEERVTMQQWAADQSESADDFRRRVAAAMAEGGDGVKAITEAFRFVPGTKHLERIGK